MAEDVGGVSEVAVDVVHVRTGSRWRRGGVRRVVGVKALVNRRMWRWKRMETVRHRELRDWEVGLTQKSEIRHGRREKRANSRNNLGDTCLGRRKD